ncbi:MAG: tRNA (adenosine(37)-N6)-threonylcarbamoyltransferase complex dimerization subunit type 1 TsaB [Terriglobia bacterium]
MLILAFDTTSEIGGAGVFRDAECLAWVPNLEPTGRYAVTLFEIVQQALDRAHLELREIELYAAANGPGSFTGIRVGLATARAWGKVFDRRVRGVSVLEAMVGKVPLTSEWVFPILDARRGEFFLGSFRRIPSDAWTVPRHSSEAADGGWVLKPESLRAFVEERTGNGASATCLVRAHDQAAIDLRTSLPASLNWQQIDGALVDSIAGIALREEQSRQPCLESNLDAYYIRRPDAEVNWRK